MKILFFPDIVGEIGRRAIVKIVPRYKRRYRPDLIIANVENIAHGIGVTDKTLDQISDCGIDCFTSGNHIFSKSQKNIKEIFQKSKLPLIRPANYLSKYPGKGEAIIETKKGKVLVINLLGQVFIEEKDVISPFKALDRILEKHKKDKFSAIFVDFHAEATSEKQALGRYADGRVTAVIGSHTHVGTTDFQILPNGTAYISDAGMVGAYDSIIGVDKDLVITHFLQNSKVRIDIPKTGQAIIDSVLIKIDPKTQKSLLIKRLNKFRYILDYKRSLNVCK